MKTYSRVYAKIDLDAVTYNMEQMKQRVGADAQFIAENRRRHKNHGGYQK